MCVTLESAYHVKPITNYMTTWNKHLCVRQQKQHQQQGRIKTKVTQQHLRVYLAMSQLY